MHDISDFDELESLIKQITHLMVVTSDIGFRNTIPVVISRHLIRLTRCNAELSLF